MLRRTWLYPLPFGARLGRHRSQSSIAGITKMVAAAGSAPATEPPSGGTRAPLLADCVAVVATARPARLEAAIWPNMPPWLASDASGTAASARLVGSAAASVLNPISGAA